MALFAKYQYIVTLPVDGGCTNPPPSFSCNIGEQCCDNGNGQASCCTINPIAPPPQISLSKYI